MPAWLAVTTIWPAPVMKSCVPDTCPGPLVTENVTGSPEAPPVARTASSSGPSPNVALAGNEKEMVCAARGAKLAWTVMSDRTPVTTSGLSGEVNPPVPVQPAKKWVAGAMAVTAVESSPPVTIWSRSPERLAPGVPSVSKETEKVAMLRSRLRTPERTGVGSPAMPPNSTT